LSIFKKFILLSLLLSSSFLWADHEKINIDELTNKLQKNNKHIIVFFHMNYCPYCIRMEKGTLKDKTIQKMIEKDFIFIDVNTNQKSKIIFENKTYSTKEFANYFDIDFFPTVLFFDKEKDIVYTARGHRKVKKFKKILKFITTKSYENMDFFDYEKEKSEEE